MEGDSDSSAATNTIKAKHLGRCEASSSPCSSCGLHFLLLLLLHLLLLWVLLLACCLHLLLLLLVVCVCRWERKPMYVVVVGW